MAVSRQTAWLFKQSSIQSAIWLLSIDSSEDCWLMRCLLFLSYEVANRTLQDVCSSTLKRQDTNTLRHIETGTGKDRKTMAEQYHLDVLHKGIDVWNQWRQEHHSIQPDFSS